MARKGKQSQAWKDLERAATEILKGQRVFRGGNFAEEDVDVIVPDLPFLKVDAKYRQRHAHHTFVAEIVRKYCEDENDEPILVTKHLRQKGAYVTVRGEFFGLLLEVFRAFDAATEEEIATLMKRAAKKRKKLELTGPYGAMPDGRVMRKREK